MSDKIKIMLATEGTYPFHQGGVSTWCDILVKNLPEVDFVIYSIIMNPFVTQKFSLPENASIIKVPLWGTEEPSEHLSKPFSQVYLAKKRTTDNVVNDRFIPLFRDLVEEILSPEKDPMKFGRILVALHKYFEEYEYKKSFKSEAAWDIYKQCISAFIRVNNGKIEKPSIYSMIQSLGWVYRFLNILNTPLPDVHATHSAAAAFCGIPCVLLKIMNNTPFLLTEHGVYLREQYLSLSQRGYTSFLNTFLMRMIHSVAGLNYAYADQVSPVCNYNTRWERKFGVSQRNIQVIYNGVDKNVMTPVAGLHKNEQPTVVTVARIDPIKDLLTLIRAAAAVKEKIPDVRFVVYGSVTVPEYYDECVSLKDKLGLSDTFIFAGHTGDVASAYRSGDIIVLSSISEAFPYSVVEAMMVSKPVIATDVGGIKEALGGSGIVVNPRHPESLSQAIIKLIENPELRTSMGEEARERALNYFTLERVLGLYLKSYIKLAVVRDNIDLVPIRLRRQRLLMEKGYALLSLGYAREAVIQLRLALKEYADSHAAPVILTEIARAYNILGEYDKAFLELEKAEALAASMKSKKTA